MFILSMLTPCYGLSYMNTYFLFCLSHAAVTDKTKKKTFKFNVLKESPETVIADFTKERKQ